MLSEYEGEAVAEGDSDAGIEDDTDAVTDGEMLSDNGSWGATTSEAVCVMRPEGDALGGTTGGASG